MNKKELVICPVYNEERTLQEFYARLRRYYLHDVLFVDDGSTDRGKELLPKIRGDRTFLIRHPQRRGYGAALISGFKYSLDRNYEKIVVIDVDMQHNPKHIPVFFKELSGVEVILGSRYIRIDRYLEVPRQRLVINRYITSLLNLLYSVNITDPFCGYRGYRASFLKKVQLREESYGFSLEIILELIRTKTAFKEVAVEIIYFYPPRRFLDGLDNPEKRLLHYLEVIARKNKEINDGKTVLSGKPTS